MRGWDVKSDALFSYVSCEARVPKDHPLRPIRQIVDKALATLSPEFEKLYAKLGRPSIPPERLLRALLLQAFYSVRSELQLMEQLDYNRLFRWFVGLSLDEAVWDETVFTKNRERLIEGDIARRFMAAVLNQEQLGDELRATHKIDRLDAPALAIAMSDLPTPELAGFWTTQSPGLRSDASSRSRDAVGGFMPSIANCCGSASGRLNRPVAGTTNRSRQLKA